MKICLMMCGFLRNFKLTFPSLKTNLLDKYDVDIYYHGYPNNEGMDISIKGIESIYSPFSYNLVEYNEVKEDIHNHIDAGRFFSRKRPETKIESVISHFWNMKHVSGLVNKEYDVYLLTRPDIYWISSPSLEDLNLAKQGKVISPDTWDFKEVHPIAATIGFLMTNAENMNKYCEMYSKIGKYFDEGWTFHPETLNGKHFQECKFDMVIRNDYFQFYPPETENYNERYNY